MTVYRAVYFYMNNSIIHESCSVSPQARIGAGTRIWHYSQIMAGAEVGLECIIGQNAFIASGVRLGNRVKLQNNISIYKGVIIEDDVFIGPSAVFTNVLNPRAHVERKDAFRDTIIAKGASIGANATIVCGIRIGRYAMIGAGSVVTRDVKDYELIVGNPSRHQGWRSRDGYPLLFQDDTAYVQEEDAYYVYEAGIVRLRS